MSKIQGCPRKDCLLIVKINMKRVVICGNMNVGEIEGLIQNVYLVFKYDAIVFFGEKQIGSIFFFLHLIADVVVDILAVYLARIAGSFDLARTVQILYTYNTFKFNTMSIKRLTNTNKGVTTMEEFYKAIEDKIKASGGIETNEVTVQ